MPEAGGGGQKYTFSESSLSSLSKKFKMESIGIISKILVSPSGEICLDGVVFTCNVSHSASFGGTTSNFVFGVFNCTE